MVSFARLRRSAALLGLLACADLLARNPERRHELPEVSGPGGEEGLYRSLTSPRAGVPFDSHYQNYVEPPTDGGSGAPAPAPVRESQPPARSSAGERSANVPAADDLSIPSVRELPRASAEAPAAREQPAPREPAPAREEPAARSRPAAREEPARRTQPATREQPVAREQPAARPEPAARPQAAAREEPARRTQPTTREQPAARPVAPHSSDANRPQPQPQPRADRSVRPVPAQAPLTRMSAPIPGLPEDLTPTPRVALRTPAPAYYRGIYLTISTARTPALFRPMLARAKEHRINALVVDVQPRMPSEEFMRLAREGGFYMIARVVVFEGGLATFPPPRDHLERVMASAEAAAQGGFAEIQLDYIRFADRATGMTLRRRYETVTGIIKLATDRLRPHGVRVGADVFGRIAFNRDDRIGQKLEVFAPHLDVIYPMLYPSHFYGDPDRRRDPYGTIRDGVRGPIARVSPDVRIVAYIQSFQMRVSESGLSLEGYVRKQLEGARDGGSAGFVAWNARNDYRAFFRALAEYDRQAAR